MPRGAGPGRWLDHDRDVFPVNTRVRFLLGEWRWGFYKGYHALRGLHFVSSKRYGKAGWLVPAGFLWKAK